MADTLNSEIWKNWDKTGKTEFTKTCVQLLKDEKCSPTFDKKGKFSNLSGYINALISNGIKGVIKRETVITILQELITLHSDVPSLILDILNVSDAETSVFDGQKEESKERQNFCYLVKECEKFLSDKLLKERLEIDTLQEVGILKNRSFYTKFIKVKTKLYYKQRKFNLFREESEGFAKLITELNQEFSQKTSHTQLLDIVKSLIGCFNLDPNRVLDVILESFENKPEDSKIFIPLVKSYMNDPKIIAEVLGSKYTFYQTSGDSTVPKALYILTAQLLQHNLVYLDDIYVWLTPEDRIMHKEWETDMRAAKEYVRKLQVISLNAKEKEDTPDEKENSIDKYSNNQKLCLCEALLEIGDWNNAALIIRRLPEHYALEYQPVAKALCNLLNYIIEPVYRENCKLGNKIKGRPIHPPKTLSNLKLVTTFQELADVAFPMLVTLGPSLRFDSVLMYKIIRVCRAVLASYGIDNAHCSPPEGATLYHDIITLLDSTVLPALSYLDCNCCVAEEIWNILKLYPYTIRYCLYSRWKNETYALYPELLRKRGDAEKQIKNIMKRVSKENVKPVGRHIGKLTHSSPGFLFDYVLLQIQVYDNLIHPVVDSLKYLTSLSYDVLGFCLIESLSNADKKRVKHDSTSISNWLQSLSSFCGAVFKKYNIELTGLLQYVANQLKAQKSLDLLILKEIVQKMAGVEAAEDLTIDQLNAMAGGELLKAEAGNFSQVRNTKKSSLRLKEAMSDQNLAVALCLLMAQQKYCIVYKETQKSHLKLVGKLSDQCQDTLVQFGTFLGSTLSVDEYVNKLPSIQSMLLDYHIPNEVAFFLARPMFNHAINIKYDQLRKTDGNYKKFSTQARHQKYIEAVKEIMEPIHKSVIPLHPAKVWEDISPQFLTTFWSLTMYDLYVPEETYQQVINKIKQQSLSILDSNTTKGKKEQERYITLMEKLQEEKKKQHEHVDKVLHRLMQEKDSWFLSKSVKSAKNETITRFLQLCLFPRCTFTAVDAIYCAKFVHTIHMLKTANFSTLLCYDRLFCDVTYSVTSCTENEAMRYGRFLYAMLETVMHWHKSKEVFEKECANYPGFVTKFRVSNQYSDNLDKVCYENFRHVCHKWHFKLAKALIICLESKDYVQIRNALIILIKIIPFFPVLSKLSQVIEKKMEKVRDEEKNKRQDLFTLATSYLGQLKQRIAGGHMMKESDFHQIPEKEKVSKSHSDGSKSENKHNGEVKIIETDDSKENSSRSSKDRSESKRNRPNVEDISKSSSKQQISSANNSETNLTKDKNSDKERTPKEDSKDKHSRKEEKRDEMERDRDRGGDREKDRDREKRKERKEEKISIKDDRSYREDRFIEMVSPKEDIRYSTDGDRYYDDRGTSHYYHDIREDREIGVSNSNSSSVRQSQETVEPDRDVKRRKMDTTSSKSSKYEERKVQQQSADYYIDKPDKKERSSKTKEKREKMSDEEKELRKERKIGRKRDRTEEALNQAAEMKRRREEEKAAKLLSHSNGEYLETSPHPREKHHHTREKSPYLRERERSHDRVEVRDKHRRGTEGKRR
ncbi:THO complex subunit 2 [Agrilus planipennis]|uniref:THO complex subunit 2 n=1 Tax=Agrilus planipennis TaxID=224129 RepID=A0A7F5R7J7_AGRPL|nr:THO complex subunit 2 [Agrilus planipennis]